MEVIDIVIAAILLFGFVKGLMKGLFVEVASLTALIAGIYGAIHFSSYAKVFVSQYVNWEPKYISLTAFAITFIGIVIVISLIGKILTKMAALIALGIVNKILGGVFGALKLALILSVLLNFFNKINSILPLMSEENIEKSILYTPTKNLSSAIFPTLLETFDKKISEKANDATKIY